MIYFYLLIAFAAGFLFGVFATSLIAVSGDKKSRHALQEYEEANEELNRDVTKYKHQISDAMAEIAHLRSQYNKARAELELLKKNGGDKRPTKKHSVKPNGGGARGRKERKQSGDVDVRDSLH